MKGKYDILFKSNVEAIKKHDEVKMIFEKESQAFFSERLKWKSDVAQQME